MPLNRLDNMHAAGHINDEQLRRAKQPTPAEWGAAVYTCCLSCMQHGKGLQTLVPCPAAEDMLHWGPVYRLARQISRLQRHLTSQLPADTSLRFVPADLCVELMLTAGGNWPRALSMAQRTASGKCSVAPWCILQNALCCVANAVQV